MLTHLAHLPLGPVEYHASVPSTNDLADERLTAGAPDLTLILADEQTAGRGRLGRSWQTPPGSALAFSLVLRPAAGAPPWAYAPLGALAVHDALAALGLPTEIKWPNDVLIGGKKVCGVLAEARWQGATLTGVVLGIGVNVHPESVPTAGLTFPATSVSTALGRRVDRWALLASILEALLDWRSRLGSPDFLNAWEERLAFRGMSVQVGKHSGVLLGLTADGELRLQTRDAVISLPAGELSLRSSLEPVDKN